MLEDTHDAQKINDDEDNGHAHCGKHYAEARTVSDELDDSKVVLGFNYPE